MGSAAPSSPSSSWHLHSQLGSQVFWVLFFSPLACSFYLFQIPSFLPSSSPAAFSSLFPLSTPPHLFPRRADGLSSGKVEPLMEPRSYCWL